MQTYDDNGPDFLCVGSKKGGTTWIYDQMRNHPDIWLPPFKELQAFDQPEILTHRRLGHYADFLKGSLPIGEDDREFFARYMLQREASLDWYFSLFPSQANRIAGDIDPNLYTNMTGLAALAKRKPKLKVILILRNPTMRSWSHVRMALVRDGGGMDGVPFDQIKKILEHPAVKDRSSYAAIFRFWSRILTTPPLMLSFDQLARQPATMLDHVWDYLGLKRIPMPPTAVQKSNSTEGPDIPRDVADFLNRLHAADYEAAARVLGIGKDQLVL